MTTEALLQDALSDVRTRFPSDLDWSTVTAQASLYRELRVAETAGVDLALVADSIRMSVDDAWPTDIRTALQHLGESYQRYGDGTSANLYGLLHNELTGLLGGTGGLSDSQAMGLINAIKGKVLEVRVQEMINSGSLTGFDPAAGHAELASSATQPGWDVKITDADGNLIQGIQVKSGTWESVRPRIEEYISEGFPVAVTSETAADAQAAGYGDWIIDTGFSHGELTEQVTSAIDDLGVSHALDELIPEMAFLSLAAFAGYRLYKGESRTSVQEWLTGELKLAGLTNAAGLAVAMLPGGVFFRPFATMGIRLGHHRALYADLVSERCRSQSRRLHRLATGEACDEPTA